MRESLPPGTLEDSLAQLPASLAHRAGPFRDLGIDNRSYLHALATLPRSHLDDVLAALRERGLTYLESLVVRQGLSALDRPALQSDATSTTLEGILPRYGGLPMARHAPMLRELGVDFAQLPVLAKLDPPLYAEFDETLRQKGLSWVERVFFKATIQSGDEREQEPLLAA